ncbi:MAG: hypothetical protein J6N22_04910, partial [Schwartzia sp.]|nr:hypothetical protein [Schwartzia sp. (in: firmicutes)]
PFLDSPHTSCLLSIFILQRADGYWQEEYEKRKIRLYFFSLCTKWSEAFKIMVDASATLENLIRQPSAATFPKGEGKEALFSA